MIQQGDYVITKKSDIRPVAQDPVQSKDNKILKKQPKGKIVARVIGEQKNQFIDVDVLKQGDDLISAGTSPKQTFHRRDLSVISKAEAEKIIGKNILQPSHSNRSQVKSHSSSSKSDHKRKKKREHNLLLTSRNMSSESKGISRVDRKLQQTVKSQSKNLQEAIDRRSKSVKERMERDGIFVFGSGAHDLTGTVSQVSNGIIQLKLLGKEFRATLSLVKLAHGGSSQRELELLLVGKDVRVIVDGIDSSGCLQVEIYVGNILVQERLVRLGLARAVIPPREQESLATQRLVEWEKKAQKVGIGMWQDRDDENLDKMDSSDQTRELFVQVENTKAFRQAHTAALRSNNTS
eukprot:gb/GECH01003051.1/.p1 GENE.gb/GECH01003051.1/~~gb/GECH01003051.1/.p1  ORF type:complete len:349 (+),score=66.93 gb/GECH01003051.1/:1-1047(+)